MADALREPKISIRGDVPDQFVAYAREKLLAVVDLAPAPVLDAELRLDHHADPARTAPDHVEMSLDLDGVPVRARRSAHTMTEAVDVAAERLRRRVEAAAERPQSRQLRHRDGTSWHHDDVATRRRAVYPRPREERVLVRRKTFAPRPESIEEALVDLETLDHDFFVFVHDDTGQVALVRRNDSGYAISQRAATPGAIERVEIPMLVDPAPAEMTVDRAVELLDESGTPYVFFLDESTGSGAVVYVRYDGNYGLITTS